MEINVDLVITAETFFERLVKRILAEIVRDTGNKIACQDLCDGFCYKKEMKTKAGGDSLVTVKAKLNMESYTYVAEFISTRSIYELSYQVFPITNGCTVVYHETIYASGTLANLNHKLMSIPYRLGAKNRVRKMIDFIAEEPKKDSVTCVG